MGTFTKSFGAVGGYIAADKATITYLRQASSGSQHSASLAPAVCQQVISAIKIILGEDGTTLGQEKLTALKDNIKFFREGISRIGCHVMGVDDSPVVPMMIYYPAKIPAFSRECLDRDLAVVVVGFPATSLIGARSRFCISAAHKRKDLADAIEKIGEVVRVVGMGYGEKYSEADIAAKRAQALKDL
jgi:serine palmitoyltransferase